MQNMLLLGINLYLTSYSCIVSTILVCKSVKSFMINGGKFILN